MTESTNLGPVELVIFTFPGTCVEQGARAVLSEVVDGGYVTILDLVHLAKDANGYLTRIEAGEPLDEIGLAGLGVQAHGILSDHDLAVVAGAMPMASSALVVVYEQTWARALAHGVTVSGGEVAVHLQIRCPSHEPGFEHPDPYVPMMYCGARADTPGLLNTCVPTATVVASSGGSTAHAVTVRRTHPDKSELAL